MNQESQALDLAEAERHLKAALDVQARLRGLHIEYRASAAEVETIRSRESYLVASVEAHRRAEGMEPTINELRNDVRRISAAMISTKDWA